MGLADDLEDENMEGLTVSLSLYLFGLFRRDCCQVSEPFWIGWS